MTGIISVPASDSLTPRTAAGAIGKSDQCECVATAVSDGRVAHFSRLGERVRRLVEDAAFLSRRFLCRSAFPSFSLFRRTLEGHRKRTCQLLVNVWWVSTQRQAITPLLTHESIHTVLYHLWHHASSWGHCRSHVSYPSMFLIISLSLQHWNSGSWFAFLRGNCCLHSSNIIMQMCTVLLVGQQLKVFLC